ncbi:MAG: PD40 domain-containing protein [Chloroflexi bacterium]|nr:PD40 domain-containing protein [Chloroflexota bacterium]
MIYAKINEHKAAGRSRVVWLVALAVVTLVAAVVVTILLLPRSSSDPGIAGVITYRSQERDVTVRPSGEQVATRFVEPAAQAETSIQGVWIAPDATTVAFVDQTDEGAWMAVWEPSGVTRLAQLTGPDSPPLVGQGKTAARAADGVPLLAAWSPDGSRLAYGTAIDGQDVFHIAESSAWSERSYGLSDGFVGELAWSPDGEHVAISSYSRDGKDHTVYVVAVDGDEMTKLVDGCLIVWSPDSRYLAVHRDPYYEPGLWVFSIDGLERHQLSDEVGATALAWLPE